MLISIPSPSVVLLIGASGSGKSTFAKRHFGPCEVLSSDFCRALVSDNEADQTATDDAFALLFFILEKRLKRRRTTAIDATNVQTSSRALLLAEAGKWQVPVVAIVFALGEDICQLHNRERAHRQVPVDVIQRQVLMLAESIANLPAEGFHSIFVFHEAGQADAATLIRETSA